MDPHGPASRRPSYDSSPSPALGNRAPDVARQPNARLPLSAGNGLATSSADPGYGGGDPNAENDSVAALGIVRAAKDKAKPGGRRTRAPRAEDEGPEIDQHDKRAAEPSSSSSRLHASASTTALAGSNGRGPDDQGEGSSRGALRLKAVANGHLAQYPSPEHPTVDSNHSASAASSPRLRHMASGASARTFAGGTRSDSASNSSNNTMPPPPLSASALTSPLAYQHPGASTSSGVPSSHPAQRVLVSRASAARLASSHHSASREALRDPARDRQPRRGYNYVGPALPSARVDPAPAACMYWSKAPIHGYRIPPPMRAHSACLVGDAIWIFGGTDAQGCFKDVWKLDAETMSWSKPKCTGDVPPAMRAHTATAVDGRIFVFGGGDGTLYTNDLYYLDTVSLTWTKPQVHGEIPSIRRAHAAFLYGKKIIIYGGGNGSKALRDVHALDVEDVDRLEWSSVAIAGKPPHQRGYHTATLVGHKAVIMGGSDGGECFRDVHILDLERLTWSEVNLDLKLARLAHTATQVGSYLFVIGGHDGQEYLSDVVLFNLATTQWEFRTVRGVSPPPTGYHTAVLHDSRIIVIGGFDGRSAHEGVWCLDLASSAFLPQVTKFDIPTEPLE